MRNRRLIAVLPLLLLASGAQAPSAQRPADAPFAVEYYYKIQWGHFAEWMELYRKNHYPVLVRQMEQGRILDMYAATPVNHAGEASRWDFRFTIVYRSAADAYDRTVDTNAIIGALYPDRATFDREEQRRFQLLVEHMDVPIVRDDLTAWRKTPPGR